MPVHPHALASKCKRTLFLFLADLNDLEQDGLENDECKKVRDCFRNAIGVFNEVRTPRDWIRELRAQLGIFLDEYVKWNDGPNDPANRKLQHRRLFTLRKKILERFEFGEANATDDELTAILRAYEALAPLEHVHRVNRSESGTLTAFKKTVESVKIQEEHIRVVK